MNAAEFNAMFEVGVPVFAYPGARPEDIPSTRRLVTRTRTEAQSVGLDREGVVWVEGHGAYIALTHVDVVGEDEYNAALLADAVAERGALPVPIGGKPKVERRHTESDPLVVRRVDMVVEPARSDGETETLVACVAENGRPVALLLDDEARVRLAGNLRMDGGDPR